MKYDDNTFDALAQEKFLMGLHRTAISEEEFLSRKEKERKEREGNNLTEKIALADSTAAESSEEDKSHETVDATEQQIKTTSESVTNEEASPVGTDNKKETPKEYKANISQQTEIYFGESRSAADAEDTVIPDKSEATRCNGAPQVNSDNENADIAALDNALHDGDADNQHHDFPEKEIVPPHPQKTWHADGQHQPLQGIIYNELQITDIKEKDPAKIHIEEDILVPDVQPDMSEILLMEGTVAIDDNKIKTGSGREGSLKVSGEISLRTIYLPVAVAGEQNLTGINSRLPFKTDWTVSIAPHSEVLLSAAIKNIEYTVVNERKFRVKITLQLFLREFTAADIKFFDGIKNEDLQTLSEKFAATKIVENKCDKSEVSEEILLKDDQAAPEKILGYNIWAVENHKQIGNEKAVVNAGLYCTIMYKADNDYFCCQNNSEITRFIPISLPENVSGNYISFDTSELTVKILSGDEEEEEASAKKGFLLSGNLITCMEVYKDVNADIVTDVYHDEKELGYDCENIKITALVGNGLAETSLREIINIPSEQSEVNDILYVKGNITENSTQIEYGKAIISGTIEFTILYSSGEENKTYSVIRHPADFRIVMEISGLDKDMMVMSEICLKNIWYDKINNRQIEINTGIVATGMAYSQKEYCMIKNVSFLPSSEDDGSLPVMVLYITQEGDSLWKIAKKFRTSVESIKEINQLENDTLDIGQKLLIVR